MHDWWPCICDSRRSAGVEGLGFEAMTCDSGADAGYAAGCQRLGPAGCWTHACQGDFPARPVCVYGRQKDVLR